VTQNARLPLNVKSAAPIQSPRFLHREQVLAGRFHQEK
jgi:hypothetical protein